MNISIPPMPSKGEIPPVREKILTPKGFTTGCSKKNIEGRVWFVRQFFLSRAWQPLVVSDGIISTLRPPRFLRT